MNVKLQATWNVAFSWLCSRCMMADNTMLTVESIKKEAQSCNMQWSEIANSAVTEWFATLAKAKGTCPEFILVGVLPTVSALMGNTTVQIFDGYEERVNLYMLGLGGPSTGKTQSHRTCIIEPILNYLEGKTGGTELLLEDASSNGLFRFFTRSTDRVAISAIDECQDWFREVLGMKGSSTAPSMKRLLQCYDGSHWYETKGNSNKRIGVSSAALALSCFTQPDAFLKSIMPRMVANDNGLLDRFLICIPPTEPTSLETRRDSSAELKDTNLSSFDRIYEQIFSTHRKADKVKYELSAEALDIYVKHIGESNCGNGKGNTKDEKNIVRIAAVIHVLFTLIDQALSKTTGVVPVQINRHVINAAISLALYFEKQRAIIRQVIFVNLKILFYRLLALHMSTNRI